MEEASRVSQAFPPLKALSLQGQQQPQSAAELLHCGQFAFCCSLGSLHHPWCTLQQPAQMPSKCGGCWAASSYRTGCCCQKQPPQPQLFPTSVPSQSHSIRRPTLPLDGLCTFSSSSTSKAAEQSQRCSGSSSTAVWHQAAVSIPSRDVTQLPCQAAGKGQAREGRQRQCCAHGTSAEEVLGPQGSELQADACNKNNGRVLGFDLQSIRESKSSSLVGCQKQLST